MNRGIAVRTEVRKLSDSKHVQAAAGAGALATTALRDLPARIARWRSDGTLTTLATEYMTTARTWALKEYDKLASDGQRVLHLKTAANGKGGTARKR
jgi:hypothetical protein